MEFPDLGEHCSLRECHRLDFLPLICPSCKRNFCTQHYKYDSHNCKGHDRQVPICPLCNKPVPIKPDESADFKVSEHIENNCEFRTEKLFKNRCSLTNCKQREMISLICEFCGLNHCLKHRHPIDHNCIKFKNGQSNQNSNQKSKMLEKSGTSLSESVSKFGNIGSDIMKKIGKDTPSNSKQSTSKVESLQGGMSEEEALNMAIIASLKTDASSEYNPMNPNPDAKKNCKIN